MDYQQIGAILRTAREKKGLVQGDIAQHLGVTKQAISLIEKGDTKASIDRLEAYAQLVDVTLVVEAIPADDRRRQLAHQILQRAEKLPDTVFDALHAWSELWLDSDEQSTRKVGSKGL